MTTKSGLTFIATVTILLFMVATSFGYASSYSATTTNTDNNISASYFTVGIYNQTNTPVTDLITTDPNLIKYTDTDGDIRLSGNYQIAKADRYIKIDDSAYIPNQTYHASILGSVTDSGDRDILTSCSVVLYQSTVVNNETVWEPVADLDPNKYYLVNVFVYFNNVQIQDASASAHQTISLTVSIDLTFEAVSSPKGTYGVGGHSITVSFTANSSAQAIININTPEDLGNYTITDVSDTTSYSSGGQNCQAVNIQNGTSTGVTNGGNANVIVKLPANTKFIISIVGSHGGPGKNTIDITIEGGGINKTFEDIGLKQNTFLTPAGKANSVPNPNGSWFVVGNTSNVTIHFVSTNGNGGTDGAQAHIVVCPT